MHQLPKPDEQRQENYSWQWRRLWQLTWSWLVSVSRRRRNQNADIMCSFRPLWNWCPWLVKWCSSYNSRGSGHKAGLFQLDRLLSVGHQRLCAKLQWLPRLLYQSNASGAPVSSALLWNWLKSWKEQYQGERRGKELSRKHWKTETSKHSDFRLKLLGKFSGLAHYHTKKGHTMFKTISKEKITGHKNSPSRKRTKLMFTTEKWK